MNPKEKSNKDKMDNIVNEMTDQTPITRGELGDFLRGVLAAFKAIDERWIVLGKSFQTIIETFADIEQRLCKLEGKTISPEELQNFEQAKLIYQEMIEQAEEALSAYDNYIDE